MTATGALLRKDKHEGVVHQKTRAKNQQHYHSNVHHAHSISDKMPRAQPYASYISLSLMLILALAIILVPHRRRRLARLYRAQALYHFILEQVIDSCSSLLVLLTMSRMT